MVSLDRVIEFTENELDAIAAQKVVLSEKNIISDACECGDCPDCDTHD